MKYPKHIYVYVCDYEKEQPIFAIAETLDDIPEDQNGELIGSYSLDYASQLIVEKTILSVKKK